MERHHPHQYHHRSDLCRSTRDTSRRSSRVTTDHPPTDLPEYTYLEAVDRNRTQSLPQCVRYDGERYVACRGCRLSSLTAVSVTYACDDVTQLCPVIVANDGSVSGSDSGSDGSGSGSGNGSGSGSGRGSGSGSDGSGSDTDSSSGNGISALSTHFSPETEGEASAREGEEAGEWLGDAPFVSEPYLSSLSSLHTTRDMDPRSRILAPKGGGKKGGGGGKKGGGGRTANKQRSANKANGKTDDAANQTVAADDGG